MILLVEKPSYIQFDTHSPIINDRRSENKQYLCYLRN